jgi:hypothetical protein
VGQCQHRLDVGTLQGFGVGELKSMLENMLQMSMSLCTWPSLCDVTHCRPKASHQECMAGRFQHLSL